MKKTKILVPALAVLALGMAASVTGTVAWFTQNAIATATGITVQSRVPSALYINGQLLASTEGDSLTLDTVSHSAAAQSLDPVHMTYANKVLTLNTPASWTTQPSQGSAGNAATYEAVATLTGGVNAVTPSASFNSYAKYVTESIVRKRSGSTDKYNLLADVTIKGIDPTNSDEATAYLTLRVGFMYSVDDGTTWYWSSSVVDNNVESGRPTQTTPGLEGEAANNKSAVYCTNFNISQASGYSDVRACLDNSVVNVIPVVWLEGQDPACYAMNFQRIYNWTIDISYSTQTFQAPSGD